MIKKIIFLLIIFNLLACDKEVKFNVINETEIVIDSVVLSNGVDESWRYDIKPKTTSDGQLNFSRGIKTDGNYELKIYLGGLDKSRRFGYYSNGVPTSSNFDFIIKSDTILVREKI